MAAWLRYRRRPPSAIQQTPPDQDAKCHADWMLGSWVDMGVENRKRAHADAKFPLSEGPARSFREGPLWWRLIRSPVPAKRSRPPAARARARGTAEPPFVCQGHSQVDSSWVAISVGDRGAACPCRRCLVVYVCACVCARARARGMQWPTGWLLGPVVKGRASPQPANPPGSRPRPIPTPPKMQGTKQGCLPTAAWPGTARGAGGLHVSASGYLSVYASLLRRSRWADCPVRT